MKWGGAAQSPKQQLPSDGQATGADRGGHGVALAAPTRKAYFFIASTPIVSKMVARGAEASLSQINELVRPVVARRTRSALDASRNDR